VLEWIHERRALPEFNHEVKTQAGRTGGSSDKATSELLGARLLGLWKSGAPIIKALTTDDPQVADGTPKRE